MMKKFIATVLAVLMATIIFTGCSTAELGFYNTIKSMDALTNYSYSGNVNIKINKLDISTPSTSSGSDSGTTTDSATSTDSGTTTDSATSTDSSSIAMIKTILNNATLSYNGSVSTKTNKDTLNLTFESGDGSFNYNFKIILDDSNNESLLDMSPLIASYIPTEFKYTEVTISGTTYDQYDINSIIKQLNSTSATSSDDAANYKSMVPALQELTTATKSTSTQKSLQKKFSSLSDSFMNTYFKNLSLGLVKKSGTNTYTYNASMNSLYSAVKSLITYIGKNPTQFKSLLISSANKLTDSEVKSLGISSVTTKTALVNILNSMKIGDATEITGEMDSEIAPVLKEISLNVSGTLQKTGTNKYSSKSSVSFNNNNQPDSGIAVDIVVNSSSTINGQ
jgi:hypothetical protein